MQTENRNMQTDCSTIIAWELLVEDSNILTCMMTHVPYMSINPLKKKEVQVF